MLHCTSTTKSPHFNLSTKNRIFHKFSDDPLFLIALYLRTELKMQSYLGDSRTI